MNHHKNNIKMIYQWLIAYTLLLFNGCNNMTEKASSLQIKLKTGMYEAHNNNDTLKLRLSILEYENNKFYFSINYYNSLNEIVRKGNFDNCYFGVFSINNESQRLNLELINDTRIDSIELSVNEGDSLSLNIFSSYNKKEYISDNQPFANKKEVIMKRTPTFFYKSSITANERQFDISQRQLYVANFKEKEKIFRFYIFPDTLSKCYTFKVKNTESLNTVAIVSSPKTKKDGFALAYFDLKNSDNKSNYLMYNDYKNHFWIREDDLYSFFMQ